MKKYVKITNSGPAQRECLEYFGLGTEKSNKEQSIGKFTTGFKMAVISATRLGMEIIVSSADETDSFILKFEIAEISVRNGKTARKDETIVYKYSDGEIFKPGIALSAFKEWDGALLMEKNKAYPIVREFVANARDEDPDFKIEFDVSDIRQALLGKTVVYIEQTEEVIDALKNYSSRYFKFLGNDQPILKIPGEGAIYPRSSFSDRRFFACGCLICAETISNAVLYEYDIYDRDIFNESRGIKSRTEYFRKAGDLILRADDCLLRTMLNNIFSKPDLFEATFLGHAGNIPEKIKEACREVFFEHPDFGKNAVLSSNSKNDVYAEGAGFKVIQNFHRLHGFFKKIGIKTSREIMEESFKAAKFRGPTEEERLQIKRAVLKYFWRINQYRKDLLSFPLLTFVEAEAAGKTCYVTGWAPNYDTIALRDVVYKDAFSLVKTMEHEFCHCVSKFHDSELGFMNWRDWFVTNLLFSLSEALEKLEKCGIKPSEVSGAFRDIEECDEEEIDAWLMGAIEIKI